LDRQFTLMSVFHVSMGEMMRPLMEEVKKHCPKFEVLATTCLMEAKRSSASYTKPRLADGRPSESEVIGEDHLFGNTSDKVIAGKKWVNKLVEQLEKKFDCQDMCRCSVITSLAALWNGANL